MLKVLGAILIVLSGGIVGVYLSMGLRNRILCISSIYSLLNYFSVSLRYTAPTVWQLMDSACENPEYKSLKFLSILKSKSLEEVSFEEAWNYSLSLDSTIKLEEKNILYSVGNSLGKVGLEESISNLNLAMERIKTIQLKATQEYSKKGNLFRWLGLLGGLMIAILIV